MFFFCNFYLHFIFFLCFQFVDNHFCTLKKIYVLSSWYFNVFNIFNQATLQYVLYPKNCLALLQCRAFYWLTYDVALEGKGKKKKSSQCQTSDTAKRQLDSFIFSYSDVSFQLLMRCLQSIAYDSFCVAYDSVRHKRYSFWSTRGKKVAFLPHNTIKKIFLKIFWGVL